MVALTLGMLAPAAAASSPDDTVDDAGDLALAASEVAAANAEAVATEATTTHSDNITCTVGSWAGVHQQGQLIPGVGYIFGRDVTNADGICAQADLLAEQPRYKVFVEIEIQRREPDGTWQRIDDDGCESPAVHGQGTELACTFVKTYDRFDTDQDKIRRAHFKVGVEWPDGTREVRSERYSLVLQRMEFAEFGAIE